MPLTDTKIRTAKADGKTRRLWDSGGLYVEISPKGGKWWRVKYRFERKEKREALGVYPAISLGEARTRRDEIRKQLALGIDPSATRKAAEAASTDRAANSFEIIAREWFAMKSPTWSPSHSIRIIRRLERDIFPWLGGQPITEVTPPCLLVVIRRIENRGALETAHRALSNCSDVFRYAIATGRAERDPCPDLKGALPPVKPTHFAAITEPAKVGGLLRMLDNYQGSLIVCCALRLAPLVFVRPYELRHAQWADMNFETCEWRYIATKTTTPHIVPLSTQSVEILQELRPLTGMGRYVFPNARSPKGDSPMSDNTVNAAMRKLGIDKSEMTGHGFRAMARTILDEVLQFRPEYIEHQLAHAVRDPTGRAYNRTTHLLKRKEMMQTWADYLQALKQGKQNNELTTGDPNNG